MKEYTAKGAVDWGESRGKSTITGPMRGRRSKEAGHMLEVASKLSATKARKYFNKIKKTYKEIDNA